MSVFLRWLKLGDDGIWVPLCLCLGIDVKAENKLADCSDPRKKDNSLVDILNPVSSSNSESGLRTILVSALSETNAVTVSTYTRQRAGMSVSEVWQNPHPRTSSYSLREEFPLSGHQQNTNICRGGGREGE